MKNIFRMKSPLINVFSPCQKALLLRHLKVRVIARSPKGDEAILLKKLLRLRKVVSKGPIASTSNASVIARSPKGDEAIF